MRPLTITIGGISRVVGGIVYLVSRDDQVGEQTIPIAGMEVMQKILHNAGIDDDISGEPVFLSIVFPNVEVTPRA